MTSTVGQWLVAASLELRVMKEVSPWSFSLCAGAASNVVMYPYQLFSQAHEVIACPHETNRRLHS